MSPLLTHLPLNEWIVVLHDKLCRFCVTTDSSANGRLLCRHHCRTTSLAPAPRAPQEEFCCGPPLVTLSTSYTLSFSQFVPLAFGVQPYRIHFNRCLSCCDGYLVDHNTCCCIVQKWSLPVKLLVTGLGYTNNVPSKLRHRTVTEMLPCTLKCCRVAGIFQFSL
jgi:hypothetical protein